MTVKPKPMPTMASRPASITRLAKPTESERTCVHDHPAALPAPGQGPLDRFESAMVFAMREASRMKAQLRPRVVSVCLEDQEG